MNLYIKETHPQKENSIIFLHGYSMAGWMWDEQVKALPDYHCIVPDLPEHGKSKDIKPFTIKSAAEKIIDIIKGQAHDGKAHLVGISLGAQIIVQILSKAPEVVDHALISGTLVNTIPPTETFLKLLDYLIKAYIPVKNDALSIGSYIRSYNLPSSLTHKFKESTYVIGSDSSNRIIRENLLFERPAGLEKADVPLLVMTGEKDYRIIKESAKDLLNMIPNSEGAMPVEVGHMWNMEDPKLFNNVLRAWITDKHLPESLKINPNF